MKKSIILLLLFIFVNINTVFSATEFERFVLGHQNKNAGLYDVFMSLNKGEGVTTLTDSRLYSLQSKFNATTESSRNEPLTRGEFLKMVIESSDCSKCKNYDKEANLSDTSHGSTQYWRYIGFGYDKKIISGYADGTFKPDNPISRAEATKILTEALGLGLASKQEQFLDVSETNTLGIYIQTAYNKGLINGTSPTTFNPDATISRGELIKILYNIQLGIKKAELTDSNNTPNNQNANNYSNQNNTNNNSTQSNNNNSDIKYGLKFVKNHAENYINDFSFEKGIVGNVELQAHGNDVKIREITFVISGINSCSQMPIIYSNEAKRLADNEINTLQDGYVYSCSNGAVTWKFINPFVISNGQKKNFSIGLQTRGAYTAYDLGKQYSQGRAIDYKKQYVNMPTGTYQIIARNIRTDKGNIENIPFGPKISYKDPTFQVISSGNSGSASSSTGLDDCVQWLSEVARHQGYGISDNLSFYIAGKCLNRTTNSSDHYVDGYYRSDGTYVSGHRRTNPDGYEYNNYSYR